jgi:hypothetical protein
MHPSDIRRICFSTCCCFEGSVACFPISSAVGMRKTVQNPTKVHQLGSLSTSNTANSPLKTNLQKDDRLQLTTAQTCTPENISVPPYPNATQWVAETLASVSSHLHVDDPTRAITQHASAARLRV